MFTLEAYNSALAQAEARADILGVASVIKLHEPSGLITCTRIDINWMDDMDNSRIIATVDHGGIITESKWVLDQLQQVGQ